MSAFVCRSNRCSCHATQRRIQRERAARLRAKNTRFVRSTNPRALRCVGYYIETGERCPAHTSSKTRLCKRCRTGVNLFISAGGSELDWMARHPWRHIAQLQAAQEQRYGARS